MTQFDFIGAKPDLSTLSIEGKRIHLISISRAFEQNIFEEFTSDITTYMIPKPADSIEETRAFIEASLEGFARADNLVFVILDKQTDEFLGCCGLHGRSGVTNPEFGIWLKRSAHGRGLGREAIRILAEWAQERMRLESFVYPVDKRNLPSRKIPESLGGVVFAEGVDEGMAGNVLEEVVYRIPVPIKARASFELG